MNVYGSTAAKHGRRSYRHPRRTRRKSLDTTHPSNCLTTSKSNHTTQLTGNSSQDLNVYTERAVSVSRLACSMIARHSERALRHSVTELGP